MSTVPEISFSVIIPAYNAESTIVRAVQSALNQSQPPLEVIVVDDASSDGTVALIEQAFGSKVQLVKKLTNQGSSAARNAGLDIARGSYIAFLDADDTWHKDKLLLIQTILESNPQISFFYHPFTQEDIDRKKLPENIMLYKLPFVKLLPANVIATSCAVIKNVASFRFTDSMRYTEDYDLWLRIGYRHKIYFIDIPLTRIYRPFLSKGGISGNRWKMRKGEMRAYARLPKLNPLFALLLPFLLLSSLGKHVAKMIIPKA